MAKRWLSLTLGVEQFAASRDSNPGPTAIKAGSPPNEQTGPKSNPTIPHKFGSRMCTFSLSNK
ncbi:hypothetical protein DPMN_139227 [Dreissena polymorpha]|uniref:Uncharacterized protein n=1 Tax=Dreissena polymorpha TaxID=45954 RepID=A0A9D4JHY7_DREPO|nr:hypothetical protein DPMN_139227 [Dreissena polymorpha]